MTFFATGNEFDSPGQELAFKDICDFEINVLMGDDLGARLGLTGITVIPQYNRQRNIVTLGRTEPLSKPWRWPTAFDVNSLARDLKRAMG